MTLRWGAEEIRPRSKSERGVHKVVTFLPQRRVPQHHTFLAIVVLDQDGRCVWLWSTVSSCDKLLPLKINEWNGWKNNCQFGGGKNCATNLIHTDHFAGRRRRWTLWFSVWGSTDYWMYYIFAPWLVRKTNFLTFEDAPQTTTTTTRETPRAQMM